MPSRLRTYRTHNPGIELISTRSGTELEETKLHLSLEALGYKAGFMNEWFLDVPAVLSEFHMSVPEMNKTIWRNRGSLFKDTDFKGSAWSIKRTVYEDLAYVYRGCPEQEIDKVWKKETRLTELKSSSVSYWTMNNNDWDINEL